MSKLKENVSDFVHCYNGMMGKKTIAVVGDIMLDLYDQIHVSRISPEFPIPVINCHDNSQVACPGGVGNVCEQLRNFNANVNLVAFQNTEHPFKNISFTRKWCVLNDQFHVPIKRRYYDGDYPLVRMDNEKPNYGMGNDIEGQRTDAVSKFSQMLKKDRPDIVILSDYNKGFFCPVTAKLMIDRCQDLGIPTIVDPKKDNISWCGCTIFKPNLAEAASFLGTTKQEVVNHWQWATKELCNKVGCKSVVITAGGKGVFVFDNGEHYHHKPARPVNEVRSVIGAGDCFVAILALAVAHRYKIIDAAQVAYEAGAVYVQNKHNEPIWPHQLLSRAENSYSKILEPTYLANYLRSQVGKRIIFTNGCFDILHTGHISTLEFAKQQGDILIVGTNTDESIKRLKGPSRPINDLYRRQIMLASLACVDFVTRFEEDTPAKLIAKLMPHVVVKGGQYATKEVVGHDMCEVVLAPMEPGLSTTILIEKMKS